MVDHSWVQLLEELPQYLHPYRSDENDRALIQIRDIVSGHRVLFLGGFEPQVSIPIPAEPNEAQRLVEILQMHRTTNVWPFGSTPAEDIYGKDSPMWSPASVFEHPVDTSVREVTTYWSDTDSVRKEIAAALVEIFRDSWGASPQRLRYTAAGVEGPKSALYGLSFRLTAVASDRPTERGAAETCTDWDDFAQRLEWALNTLPFGAVLNVHAPSTDPDYGFVGFTNQSGISSLCKVGPTTTRDLEELRQRMSGLGWRWDPYSGRGIEYPGWLAPPSRTRLDSTLGSLIPRVVATLRDVFGVMHPKELTFAADSCTDDSSLAYLDAELGLTRQPND
ncbi:hypothetical protein GPX89_30740 [Nocardia sp. ET3-3]|uniref:TY-Chap N-terminal domain-containing protein n=1 Tax=Nocardia terrae TaxID=2675851 RepID=A0A7K1V4N7_9NOCA|nr:hypothetical protein [Nocardia terrae]MVU81605.1 hypothetical protein [Nocardia terrae]